MTVTPGGDGGAAPLLFQTSGDPPEACVSPVGLLDVVMAAAFLQTQDLVQRLSGRGQGSLPLLRHGLSITCSREQPLTFDL